MNKHSGLDLVERARALQPLILRDADIETGTSTGSLRPRKWMVMK